MGRKPNEVKRVRFNTLILPSLRDQLRRMALAFGFRHGQEASANQMLEHLIAQSPDPIRDLPVGDQIADFIFDLQPFRAKWQGRWLPCFGARILRSGNLVAWTAGQGSDGLDVQLGGNLVIPIREIEEVKLMAERWFTPFQIPVVIRLWGESARRFRGSSDEDVKERANGELEVCHYYSHSRELLPTLLAMGPQMEVVGPSEVRELFSQTLRAMLIQQEGGSASSGS